MCLQSEAPCLHCHPEEYIRMVQHLIERCLIKRMSREECVNALAKHANIDPVVTCTVWNELRKENQSFFEQYFRSTKSQDHSKTSMGTISGDDSL